ncbi:hypothetical protein GCK32_009400 [Trichostrongylus colubriformis]|uniref:Uncharacterized protein n=1 Tax=Trichostrongylus colubriformis TaxID=6319 RepID=A0AAN8FE91_TRICO
MSEILKRNSIKRKNGYRKKKRWLTELVSSAKVTGGDEEHPEAEAELTDDQYVNRLVDESSGGNEEMDARESASVHTDKLHEVPGGSGQQAEINRLEKILKEFEYAQCHLPRRRIGKVSDDKASDVRCTFCLSLEHFSDSCPRITDGDERYRFVKRRNLCLYCLEDCDPNRSCLKKGKGCFYCEVIRKTKYLHFLIPKDPGHHRALCNITNSKNIIAERIQELKHEIERVRRFTQSYWPECRKMRLHPISGKYTVVYILYKKFQKRR